MSSLLGPVTDADLRRWQRRRFDLLSELMRAQDQRELPPLTWTLSVHNLVGTVTGHHPTEIRRIFDAWVIALGLDRSPEVHHDTGRIHLGHCQECIPFGGEFLMTTEPDLREQFAPSGDALC